MLLFRDTNVNSCYLLLCIISEGFNRIKWKKASSVVIAVARLFSETIYTDNINNVIRFSASILLFHDCGDTQIFIYPTEAIDNMQK